MLITAISDEFDALNNILYKTKKFKKKGITSFQNNEIIVWENLKFEIDFIINYQSSLINILIKMDLLRIKVGRILLE